MGILLCLRFLQEVNTGEFRNLEVFRKCNIGCPTFVDVIKIPQNSDTYKVAKMTRKANKQNIYERMVQII